MKCYQEITLIPGIEIEPYFLWSKLYTQLHLAFVELKDKNEETPIGVSFPQYRYDQDTHKGTLGNKVRVFAPNEQTLAKLDLPKWLNRINDYVHCTSVKSIELEKVIGYANYQRLRAGNSAESWAKRYIKRHKNDALDMAQLIKNYSDKQKSLKQPFIQLKSLTNGNQYRLYIQKRLTEEKVNHQFSTYGLSEVSTVPEF